MTGVAGSTYTHSHQDIEKDVITHQWLHLGRWNFLQVFAADENAASGVSHPCLHHATQGLFERI